MNPPDSVLPRLRLANSAGAARAARRPLISLTPLIDVVFILLVFFMLASSFLNWRAVDLNAPANTSAASSSAEGAMLVEIRADDIRLSGETVTPEVLTARISERLRQRPEQRVLVKPAAGVPLQRTVEVLDSLAAAGVTDMSLMRDKGR